MRVDDALSMAESFLDRLFGRSEVVGYILHGIGSGALRDAPTEVDSLFGIAVPTEVEGVPPEVLRPRSTWTDKSAFDATSKKLALLFAANFAKYEAKASDEIRNAGPKI